MITRYGQEYDDADPMLGDYADLAQKGFGIFKKFGKGAKKVVQKIAARVRAHKAKRTGKAAPVKVAAPVSPAAAYVPTARIAPSSEGPIVVDHPRGLPGWVIPAAAVGAAYFLLTRRGE
jgi:hypothetical protein